MSSKFNRQDLIPQKIQPKKSIKIIQSGKIKNYVEAALSIFQNMSREESDVVVFSGRGPAINKTISVVEIIKRRLNDSLHQYTQIGRNFSTQDEGKEEKEDDEMILDRGQKEQERSRDKLPAPVIVIYLCSKANPHLEETLGYQHPTPKGGFR